MGPLLAALIAIAVSFTGLPTAEAPHLQFLTQRELHQMFYPETEWKEGYPSIIAAYKEGHIFLRGDWEKTSRRDQSILLHEVVHHLQYVSGAKYTCPGLLEKVAYDAQIRFLSERGLDFFELFESDPLFIMLVTTCRFGR